MQTNHNTFYGYQDAFIRLAQSPDIGKMDHRLLLYLIHLMDTRNNAFVTNKFLADTFGVAASYISKSLKNLIELGCIRKESVDGVTCFHVNDEIGYKKHCTK